MRVRIETNLLHLGLIRNMYTIFCMKLRDVKVKENQLFSFEFFRLVSKDESAISVNI